MRVYEDLFWSKVRLETAQSELSESQRYTVHDTRYTARYTLNAHTHATHVTYIHDYDILHTYIHTYMLHAYMTMAYYIHMYMLHTYMTMTYYIHTYVLHAYIL